ncbi:MAG: ribosome recycling factor [Clostridia bacterium]
MQYKDEYDDIILEMDSAISSFKEHLHTVRAGRANPALLNTLAVDYYGVRTPVSQLGNISVPEARLLVIQPWDKSILKDIEKALLASDIGITPSNDGSVIRLTFPILSEERRKDLVKLIKGHGEEAKVKIRNIRRDAIDIYKVQKKNSEITEDDYVAIEKDLQEITDDHIKLIDSIINDKSEEITEV